MSSDEQQHSNTETPKENWWKRNQHAVKLTAGGVGIAAAGIAVGVAVGKTFQLTMATVEDLTESAVQGLGE